MIFHRDLQTNLHVCQNCGHHMRIPLAERLAMLFDEGKFTRIDLPDVVGDPLKFRDDKRYTDRLKEARNKTGETDAAIVAHGKLDSVDVVIAGLNFAFMGGSMGVAVGEALVAASELAVERKAPLIAITASGGARMQEGPVADADAAHGDRGADGEGSGAALYRVADRSDNRRRFCEFRDVR